MKISSLKYKESEKEREDRIKETNNGATLKTRRVESKKMYSRKKLSKDISDE